MDHLDLCEFLTTLFVGIFFSSVLFTFLKLFVNLFCTSSGEILMLKDFQTNVVIFADLEPNSSPETQRFNDFNNVRYASVDMPPLYSRIELPPSYEECVLNEKAMTEADILWIN
jgi:hypothetical protein